MTEAENRMIKELPLKIILTSEGESFFINQNKKVNRFKMADNLEERGIYIDNFAPRSIQKMMLQNFISKIEISRTEFVSKRQEIMDLTKLFVFSVLYKQLDNIMYKKILDSTLIKNWNRKNPGNIIDERTIINRDKAERILLQNEKQVQLVKKAVLAPILVKINVDRNLLAEERKIKYFICEKFLDNLRPSTWLILTRFQKDPDYLVLLSELRECIMEFLDKTKIAEYLSLMVMELVINAENTNMQKYVKKQYKDTINIEHLYSDPHIRKKILNEMELIDETLYLTWKIGGRSNSISSRNKLQVILYNRESEYRKIKQVIDDKKGINLRKKSLTDFYKATPDSFSNSELGLYYLSYLIEACEKVNIKFDSIVNQLSKSDLTVITLSLMF